VEDLQHLTQKFPGGPITFQEISRISRRVFKFQEISSISRSCRHPENEHNNRQQHQHCWLNNRQFRSGTDPILLLGDLIKTAQGSITLNRIGMKFGTIVQVNMLNRQSGIFNSTSHFQDWRPWHHFTQKTTAIWRLNMKHMPAPM